MTGPDPRPGAVDNAAGWVLEHMDQYTPEILEDQLRVAGYSEAEIWAARAEANRRRATTPVPHDLRTRAAAILIVAFLGTWGVLSYLMVAPPTNTYGSIGAGILGLVLGLLALVSLAGISQSRRLRRGAQGALVTILAVPFVLLVIVAGLCVATTGGIRV